MSREVFVRPLQQNEIETFEKWMEANAERSLLDREIFQYPTVRVLAAQNGKVLGYLPYHSVLTLESFSPNPDATDSERAEACRQFVKMIYSVAWTNGVREIYYFGNDQQLNRIAERHGFEKIECPVYRLRVK